MTMSVQQKIDTLRDLTRGAEDVFAMRSGDFWRPVYAPLEDKNIALHLSGKAEIGSYPLIPPYQLGLSSEWPQVRWIAADFDGKGPNLNWKADVQRSVQMLLESECTLVVNLSRSAQGAHVRVLFSEPVPAWMARRWMRAWLDEAGVVQGEFVDEVPSSFDRLIPPQDRLKHGTNRNGYRLPGNLIGSPLHKGKAKTGGTLLLDPQRVAEGSFEPDGRHWEYAVEALERRSWGEERLREALTECPEPQNTNPPARRYHTSLPVLPGDDGQLGYVLNFCRFIDHMRQPDTQNYHLWLALATNLQRFGESGRKAFHAISAYDARYDAAAVDKKWEDTKDLSPVRCTTLVDYGFRCPHLDDLRCSGAPAPAFFAEYTEAEIL